MPTQTRTRSHRDIRALYQPPGEPDSECESLCDHLKADFRPAVTARASQWPLRRRRFTLRVPLRLRVGVKRRLGLGPGHWQMGCPPGPLAVACQWQDHEHRTLRAERGRCGVSGTVGRTSSLAPKLRRRRGQGLGAPP